MKKLATFLILLSLFTISIGTIVGCGPSMAPDTSVDPGDLEEEPEDDGGDDDTGDGE